MCAASLSAKCPFCVYGRSNASSGTCKCTCFGLAVGPACSYTNAENASLMLYINRTEGDFSATRLMTAVASACSVDVRLIEYGYAVRLAPKFAAMKVRLRVPGYAAGRLYVSVAVEDLWVRELGVVGVYPELPLPATVAAATHFDMVLYDDGQSVIVTLSGIGWLAGCCLLAVGAAAVDATWLWNAKVNFTPVEEEQPTADVLRRRSLAYKQSGVASTPQTPLEDE